MSASHANLGQVHVRTRRILIVALLLALSGPVFGAGAVLADDMQDLLFPADDPRTPGPDLYHGRSLDDGVPDMPDLVTMAAAPGLDVIVPPNASARSLGDYLSAASGSTLSPATPSRAPPASSSR